jgi:hypothetical protein
MQLFLALVQLAIPFIRQDYIWTSKEKKTGESIKLCLLLTNINM